MAEGAAAATTDAGGPPPDQRCLNCGAGLTGKFCAACGQRDDRHVHSLSHFLAEAFEGLSHADSRLWRTLWPLLVRPGFLTREFFAGRRQRYLPPFRLYLVVSLLFFLVLALLPDAELLRVGSRAGTGSGEPVTKGVYCDALSYQGPGAAWLQPRLVLGCQKSLADRKALGRAFAQNVPRAMFLFLPLIAAFMLLLYWRPRRYYVEHLLFFIHNHAMVFLLGTLLLPLSWLLRGGLAENLLKGAELLWLAWYLYRAMRVYYGQGRRRTLAKYVCMGGVYLVVSLVMLVFTVLFSVATL